MDIRHLRHKYDSEYKIRPAKLAPLYLTEEIWMNDKAPLDEHPKENPARLCPACEREYLDDCKGGMFRALGGFYGICPNFDKWLGERT